MKFEKIVTNFKYSSKLHDLKFTIASDLWWYENGEGKYHVSPYNPPCSLNPAVKLLFPAYTAEDILTCFLIDPDVNLEIRSFSNGFEVALTCRKYSNINYFFEATIRDALAKAKIWLLERSNCE